MAIPVVLAPVVSGLPLSSTDLNNNWAKIENAFTDVAPYVISGLAISAGTGLSVNVALGVAVIGAEITKAVFVIGSLTPSTTNHLYLNQDGTGTSNTTGTQPAKSVKLGTAVTGVATVTSVAMGRTSGRQQFVQSQNLIPGGPANGTTSAGHPDAIDLSSWNATDIEGKATFGTLPAGAQAAQSLAGLSDVTLTSVARGDVLYRGATRWNNRAAGTSGQALLTGGAGADPNWGALNLAGGAPFVTGILPAGNLPATTAFTDAANVFTHASGNTFRVNDASTTTAPAQITLAHHLTSGVPGVGFGDRIDFTADNNSNALVTYGQIKCLVSDGTAAAEKGLIAFFVNYSGTLVESLRCRATGTATTGTVAVSGDLFHLTATGAIGFYNVGPVTRQTVTGSRVSGAALADLLTKLAATGLIIDSSSA